MKIATDGWEFDFTDAIDAFVFDETDKKKPTFHGAPMKAVDLVVELKDYYLFVEIKEYDDLKVKEIETAADKFNWLKRYLKYKFRDTFLYRFAENKVEKPIQYLCLLNFESALNSLIKKELVRELPVVNLPKRWKNPIVKGCQVLNEKDWNTNFPKWNVRKLP